jgi:hypothetical protein
VKFLEVLFSQVRKQSMSQEASDVAQENTPNPSGECRVGGSFCQLFIICCDNPNLIES